MSLQKSEQLLKSLNSLIDKSVDSFNNDIPRMERDMFNRIQLLLRDLDLSRGKIKSTVKNLRKINRLKREMQNAILNNKYLTKVGAFNKSFEQVTTLQTTYFSTLESGFELPAFVDTLKNSSVVAATEALTEAGIKANITDKAADLIKRNITEGASFGELVNEMRNFLTKTEQGAGALSRYASLYTTDALNTYAAEYNQVVSEDLGFEWFLYTGALVEDSRDFCVALVKKKWIHISEFKKITNPGKPTAIIDNKSVSKAGLKKGTNPVNFKTLRGGWRCNHLVSGISTEFVPEKLQKKFD